MTYPPRVIDPADHARLCGALARAHELLRRWQSAAMLRVPDRSLDALNAETDAHFMRAAGLIR